MKTDSLPRTLLHGAAFAAGLLLPGGLILLAIAYKAQREQDRANLPPEDAQPTLRTVWRCPGCDELLRGSGRPGDPRPSLCPTCETERAETARQSGTAMDDRKACPHAEPFVFCHSCVVSPCPIGLGRDDA